MDHRQHTATGQKWEGGSQWWVSVMCWWGWRCGECTTSVTNSVWIDRWIDCLDLSQPPEVPVGKTDSLTTGSSTQRLFSCIPSFIKCLYILNPPLIMSIQTWNTLIHPFFFLCASFLTASYNCCLSLAHIRCTCTLFWWKTTKRLIRTLRMVTLPVWIQYVAGLGSSPSLFKDLVLHLVVQMWLCTINI